MIDNEEYSIILPGRIVSFDSTTQTAEVLVCADAIYSGSEETRYTVDRVPIPGVPVHVSSGGGWSCTFPIEPGNTCILFFSQVGYDHWFYLDDDVAGTLAGLPKPWLGRKFNEDDGFALVGLNTLPRKIINYSSIHSQWRNEDATQIISLNDDGSIDINSTVKVTINAPAVEVNCDSSVINSDSNTINGPLHCTGIISSDAQVQAPTIAASTNLTVASKEMGLHTHNSGTVGPPD